MAVKPGPITSGKEAVGLPARRLQRSVKVKGMALVLVPRPFGGDEDSTDLSARRPHQRTVVVTPRPFDFGKKSAGLSERRLWR